jgi:hypothetical protein
VHDHSALPGVVLVLLVREERLRDEVLCPRGNRAWNMLDVTDIGSVNQYHALVEYGRVWGSEHTERMVLVSTVSDANFILREII